MHTDSITERTFQLPSIPPPRRVTLAPSCMQSTNRQTASGPLMADLTSSFYRPEISDPNMCPEHKQTDNDSSSHSRLLPPPPTGLRSALFHPWRVNMTPNHSSPLGVSDSLCSSSPHNKTFSTFSYSTLCSSFIHSFILFFNLSFTVISPRTPHVKQPLKASHFASFILLFDHYHYVYFIFKPCVESWSSLVCPRCLAWPHCLGLASLELSGSASGSGSCCVQCGGVFGDGCSTAGRGESWRNKNALSV